MANKICLHRNKVLSPNRDDAKAALKNALSKAADGEIMINRYKDGNVIKVLIGIHTDSTEAGITKDFILDSDAMPKDADELTWLIEEETLRSTDTEDTIKVAVGLDENGNHKTTTGHYTNKATTVVGEIAALDSQVYTNTGAIALLDNIAKTLRQTINDERNRAEGVENTIKDYTVNGKAISTNPSFTGVGAIKIANTKEGNTVDVSLKLSDPDNNLLVIDENGLNVKEVIDCGTYA